MIGGRKGFMGDSAWMGHTQTLTDCLPILV